MFLYHSCFLYFEILAEFWAHFLWTLVVWGKINFTFLSNFFHERNKICEIAEIFSELSIIIGFRQTW